MKCAVANVFFLFFFKKVISSNQFGFLGLSDTWIMPNTLFVCFFYSILKHVSTFFSCWKGCLTLFCCEALEIFCGLREFYQLPAYMSREWECTCTQQNMNSSFSPPVKLLLFDRLFIAAPSLQLFLTTLIVCWCGCRWAAMELVQRQIARLYRQLEMHRILSSSSSNKQHLMHGRSLKVSCSGKVWAALQAKRVILQIKPYLDLRLK